MKIQTAVPFISESHKITSEIAQFWDTVSHGWQTIIGPHIHHGYYENSDLQSEAEGFHKNIIPKQGTNCASTSTSIATSKKNKDIIAQERLIQKIANILNIAAEIKILDVGCGMGGTSLFLAQNYGANVIGISISAQQLALARKSLLEARKSLPENLNALNQNSLNQNAFTNASVNFKQEDAHSLASLPDNHFDIVWSLESCEQFYDKALFIKQAMRVLKPKGKLMIATWCSDAEYYEGKKAKIYQSLCKSFQLPYMPTIAHYSEILKKHGNLIFVEDWSENVKYSWDMGIHKLKSYSWLTLFKMSGLIGLKFILKLRLMSTTFKNGQLRYGVFVLQK